MLASWAVAGLGIGYLPVQYHECDIRAGRLRMIDVQPRLPSIEYVAVLDRRHTQPLTQTVADLAATVSNFERKAVARRTPALPPPKTRKRQ